MIVSARLLLAASLCLAPLGWAAAQDQQPHDDQHQRHDHQDHQDQHHQQQQQPPHGSDTAPQGQHVGGPGGGQQFQRPAQNHAPPPGAQPFQRPVQNNTAPPSPPAGATASPTPPAQTQRPFQHVQGPPQNSGAPRGSAQPQQQQFQQRSVQHDGPPPGSAAPQVQVQPQPQRQQTTNSRSNFQSGTRSTNSQIFVQHHGGAAPTQFNRGRFYGHDYPHFTPHEAELWHRGAWHHEFHDGRFGWWYAVDGIWYFYDQPVYPYPTFVPDVVYIPEEEEAPPPVYVDAPPEPAPPQSAPAQYGQPPTYYYYFCPDTQTYYPYVNDCASPWQPVPAAPPQ